MQNAFCFIPRQISMLFHCSFLAFFLLVSHQNLTNDQNSDLAELNQAAESNGKAFLERWCTCPYMQPAVTHLHILRSRQL